MTDAWLEDLDVKTCLSLLHVSITGRRLHAEEAEWAFHPPAYL